MHAMCCRSGVSTERKSPVFRTVLARTTNPGDPITSSARLVRTKEAGAAAGPGGSRAVKRGRPRRHR
jgi:hypothetical protein